MNKKLIVKLGLAVLSLSCSNLYAEKCSISSFSAQRLVLLPQQYNSTNFAFSVACQQNYTILFSSLNSHSNDGVGFLKNGANQIKVKMSAQSHQNLPWGLPIQQNNNNQYFVTVSILEPITTTTAAGIYKDNIKIQIEF